MRAIDRRRRTAWVGWLALSLSACGGGGDEVQTDAATGPSHCTDPDGDGFGEGAECLGDDCDEGNPARREGCASDCAAFPEDVGCPCDAPQPLPCFEGPSSAANVGSCRPGLRTCAAGVWTHCQGQILPSAQEQACDGLDEDCDGTIDQGVTNECGTCGACETRRLGAAEWLPAEEGRGVIEQDGDLTLSPDPTDLPSYAWVASQTDATVTLVDLETRVELARYWITPLEGLEAPMSIAVTPWGGALLAVGDEVGGLSRGNRLTRIAPPPCPDRDGDGEVRTSTGYDDVFEHGDDECQVWSLTYDFHFRVAVWDSRLELDGLEEHIWVSETEANALREIDADGTPTGRSAQLPFEAAGVTLGPDGRLWAAPVWDRGQGLANVDPETLDVTLHAPDFKGQKLCSIAADAAGNVYVPNDEGSLVWVAASDSAVDYTACVSTVAATDRAYWGSYCTRDIVRTAIQEGGISEEHLFPLPGELAHGDFQGWGYAYPAVSMSDELLILDSATDGVYWMDPESGALDPIAENIPSPGTCGDPTGIANVRSAGARGTYDHVFEGCADGETRFTAVLYEATTPPGTEVTFSARIADRLEALGSAPPVAIGSAPADGSPLDLAPHFGGEPPLGAVLALRMTLLPFEDRAPRVSSVAVRFSCEGDLQ